jgi:signal transduction histidine kinase
MISHSYFGMYRLTDNLSALAAILRGDAAAARTSYDIVGACRALVASTAHLTGDSGCRLRFESNEESLVISADRRLMNKLLLNLLSNSLMNTAPGGEVTVSVLSVGERIVLSVCDNGSGIRGEVLPTVWNRYGTLKAPAEKTGGVGLGLTLVQHIARLHGGSAVLESRQGEGTTVTISLPAEAPGTPCGGFELADNGDYGTQQLLAELSGIVGYDKYTQLYLD